MILEIEDFDSGRYEIALDPSQEMDLQLYIDQVEEEYIVKMFGKELYDLFILDWNAIPVGVPTDVRFQKVYQPFTDQNNDVLIQSKGMVEMLKAFVYYRFVRDQITLSSTTGAVSFIGENVEAKNGIQHDITTRYNDGVDTYKTIQYYMSTFEPTVYPEFKGIDINFANII